MTESTLHQGTRLMRTLLVTLGFIAGVSDALTVHYHLSPALVWAFSRGDE